MYRTVLNFSAVAPDGLIVAIGGAVADHADHGGESHRLAMDAARAAHPGCRLQSNAAITFEPQEATPRAPEAWVIA